MIRTTPQHFNKTLLALAINALVVSQAWGLDLATAPPGTKEPYVAPNVIISVDDSGSMDFRLDREDANGASDSKVPGTGGIWPVESRRMNVLKHALVGNGGTGGIFRDTTLLPDGKIRLAWQVMHNNGNASDAKNVDSASMNTNSMRSLTDTQRTNFINFVNSLTPRNGTPSHLMFQQADDYMRRTLSALSRLPSFISHHDDRWPMERNSIGRFARRQYPKPYPP